MYIDWCIGNVSAAKPQQPISDDDESNQHLMNDEQSGTDNIANDGGNCSNSNNENENNIVMQDIVG